MAADGGTMAAAEAASPLDDHRLVVASATYDEMDRMRNELDVSRDLSVATAQTEPADNTHPYLMRYSDMYAHGDDATAASAGPTFVNVTPPAEFSVGQKVTYKFKGNAGTSEAVVVKVTYDAERRPHYTIRLSSGKEKQTQKEQLDKATTAGATDENGEAVGPIKCVDFKVNPTPLFKALYAGRWEEARDRLKSNPEEAKVWVARYAKKDAEPDVSKSEVRWQLLPLHLFVALGGHADVKEGDVPEEGNAPPLQLLAALLEAYPQATQCTDDQAMIPLHSALRGNASLAVIANLLDADPASVYRKDSRGRNAFVLAEKVYILASGEEETLEGRHAKLTELLTEAAQRVASPAPSPARSPAQGAKEKEGGLAEEQSKKLHRLQSENLALRRENAELRHRAEIHERMLLQLVEKLQEYEDMRSVDIENYNEVFGSMGELARRREGILTSISEDEDGPGNEENEEEEEKTEEKVQTDEKPVGGDGAYHKRLERYLHSTPTGKVGVNIISPVSTMTTDTAEPGSSVSPSVLLPKLDGCAQDDAKDPDSLEENVEVVLEGDGEEVKGEAGDANARGQDIFRPRDREAPKNDAPAETQASDQKSDSEPADATEQEVDETDAEDSATEGLPEAPLAAFDREVMEKAASLKPTTVTSSPEAPADTDAPADEMAGASDTKVPVAEASPHKIDDLEGELDELHELKRKLSKGMVSETEKETDDPSAGNEDIPGRRVLPVLSWEEEDQLQVE